MKYFLTLLFSLALFACGGQEPLKAEQTAQGLGAAWVSGCTYKPSTKKLDGTVKAAQGVYFPMKLLELTLKDASLNVLDVISIAPTQVWPAPLPYSSLTQTVTTNVTTNVAKVVISGTDDHTQYVWQNCDVI